MSATLSGRRGLLTFVAWLRVTTAALLSGPEINLVFARAGVLSLTSDKSVCVANSACVGVFAEFSNLANSLPFAVALDKVIAPGIFPTMTSYRGAFIPTPEVIPVKK